MPLGNPPYIGLSLNLPLARSPALGERVQAAEDSGYDLFSITDHPYVADVHEAYSTLAFALGRTRRIAGYVGVTNLPLRPAPVLARSLATLSSLSGDRVVLGIGSGGYWDRIARFGVARLSETYRRSRPVIDDAAAAAGRDPADIIDYFNFGGVLASSDLRRTRGDDGRWIGGSARQWTDELTGAVLEHRAGGFNTTVTNESGDADLATLRRFAEEVIPAVRDAVR
ncbi:MAG: LLM class flavin-dependent oxidoreductase [Solirubrobacteraceae bacterium]